MKDLSRRSFLASTLAVGAAIPLRGLALPYNALGTHGDVPPRLKPPMLKPGDTVAISSPAGAIWDDKLVEEFSAILTGMGLKIKKGETLTQKYGYLAGSDALRAGELNAFFKDPEVKAIFSAKGGWGCARLLPLLDYAAIKQNPKIIMGFSDITSLLLALYAKTGLVTFHGPVGNSSWGPFSMQYVKQVLMQPQPVHYTSPADEKEQAMVLHEGKAQGVLLGGNLSVLASMAGTPYLPAFKNAILFLEETAEEPYRLDRLLTQLKQCGILDNISGLVFGKCSKCEAEEPDKAFTFSQVLEQHIIPLGIPAFYNSMIGHVRDKFTLPLGIPVEIDAAKGTLRQLESAVV